MLFRSWGPGGVGAHMCPYLATLVLPLRSSGRQAGGKGGLPPVPWAPPGSPSRNARLAWVEIQCFAQERPGAPGRWGTPQDGPNTAQDAPGCRQDAPKTPQEAPRQGRKKCSQQSTSGKVHAQTWARDRFLCVLPKNCSQRSTRGVSSLWTQVSGLAIYCTVSACAGGWRRWI